MSSAASGLRSFRVFLEVVKIEHSVFALPFAMIGMMWGAKGWPGWWVLGWIVVAMVSCRSAAMTGIPPPTLASKKRLTLFAAAI